MHLDRRQALRRFVLGGVGVATLPTWVESLVSVALAHPGMATPPAGPEVTWTPKALSPSQAETVTSLSELIIPETDTPGARQARVVEFIDAVLDDADDSERRQFFTGLTWIDRRCQELFGGDFLSSNEEQQIALLTILSSEKNTAPGEMLGVEFFTALKALTVTGYYTSEAALQELGDDGLFYFLDYPGCQHPEHQAEEQTP